MTLRILLGAIWLAAAAACGGGGGTESSASQTATNSSSTVANPTVDPLGWEEATPESVGLLVAELDNSADIALADGTFGQALVVIKDGKLVYERYRGITDREKAALSDASGLSDSEIELQLGSRNKDSLGTSWSMAKSFTSTLIGIAIEQGLIGSVDDLASFYITEWADDERAAITLRNLLDMRSGLIPICGNPTTQSTEECGPTFASGGNIVYADDQMTACIERPLTVPGDTYPWYNGGSTPFPVGGWVYSNCDTMVLGEILFRVMDDRLQTYADEHLFSKLGMTAYWWRDNSGNGQVDGNYLAYCCIDATARDFARFRQMLLDQGAFAGRQVVPIGYVDAIRTALLDETGFYNYQFWATEGGTTISALGFDQQSITIDPVNNLVVVRMGLYRPILNRGNGRVMKLVAGDADNSNWVGSLPQGSGINYLAPYNRSDMMAAIYRAL